jgi:predicted metal-binding protein
MNMPENQIPKERIEEIISDFPIYEYAWTETDRLPFDGKVREICRSECSMYGTRWHCPPVVGTVAQCRDKIADYPEALVFSTIWEADNENLTEMLGLRKQHEEMTAQIRDRIAEAGCDTAVLSTGCIPCEKCTYPDKPCRNPDTAFPTIESAGIVLPLLVEKTDMELSCGAGLVTYFSIILIRPKRQDPPNHKY